MLAALPGQPTLHEGMQLANKRTLELPEASSPCKAMHFVGSSDTASAGHEGYASAQGQVAYNIYAVAHQAFWYSALGMQLLSCRMRRM